MSETTILPCPFCGEVPQVKIRGARTYSVSCCSKKCFVQPEMSFIFEHERHAISPWNKRALTPKQEAAEEMFEALKLVTEELDGYVDCSDGCTCGDGWIHADARIVAKARAALAKAGRP